MPTSAVKEVFRTLFPLKTESKKHPLFRFALGGLVALLACGLNAHAQTIRAQITVISLSPARVQVQLELPTATNSLSFRNSYAGILGLGERIEKVKAATSDGAMIEVRKLAPGEFRASEKGSTFNYEVNVAVPVAPGQMSHVSWLDSERGILMLADLLPQSTRNSAVLELKLPDGWSSGSNLTKQGLQFSTDDPESAMFLIGRSVKEKSRRLGTNKFSLVSVGGWPFSADEAIASAERMLGEHSRVTKSRLNRDMVLMLVPYAGEAGPERWTAETRGNTVVLLLGSKANRRRVFATLEIILSHELFHLWIPNSLKLEGEYDWFFEGFTLYHALRTDLRLGLIDFDNYLDTIARVYDAYRANTEREKLSLLEASERRWTTASSFVYEQGMLTAFVYDLSLRKASNCGASLDDVYADLFRFHATGQANANETIIRLLTGQPGMKSFAKDYVETPAQIRLDDLLAPYGIELDEKSPRSRFFVRADLNESQRRLLKCLGYKK